MRALVNTKQGNSTGILLRDKMIKNKALPDVLPGRADIRSKPSKH